MRCSKRRRWSAILRSKAQRFNSGTVRIYTVTNSAEDGAKPVETLTLVQKLRYHERTVGLTRYYEALQANVRVQYVLRCPRLTSVSTQDVAIPNDGRQYRIVQVQYPEDVQPPVMDLTLEEVAATYGIS